MKCECGGTMMKLDEDFYCPTCKSVKACVSGTAKFYEKSEGPVFGLDLFNSGGKRAVMCFGVSDTQLVAEVSHKRYNRYYPVVGLITVDDLLEARTKLRSFDEVVLLFPPNLDPIITEEVVRMIGKDKVKIGRLNDSVKRLHSTGGDTAVLNAIFDAEFVTPPGVIKKDKLWEVVVDYNNIASTPYPDCLAGLNVKLKGARLGEITLFTSGTSCGKSTIMREIALHFSTVTEHKIGIIALEESPAETARKMAGMSLKKNPAAASIPMEELKKGFDAVFSSDKFILLDHQGAVSDVSIIDKMEYMALSGCKFIIIDHITILVSEGAEGLTGNEAIDKMMNDLLRFVKKYDVWIGLVSHLRKTPTTGKSYEEGAMPNLDAIKGSGSIKQICFDIVGFARNLMEDDPERMNVIQLAVLKCRYTGLTGNAQEARYNYDTGRIESH